VFVACEIHEILCQESKDEDGVFFEISARNDVFTTVIFVLIMLWISETA